MAAVTATMATSCLSGVLVGGLAAIGGLVGGRASGAGRSRREPRALLRLPLEEEEDEDCEEAPPRRGGRARPRRAPAAVAGQDPEDLIGWRLGFSMEEARAMADAGQQAALNRRPAEVLVELQKGNCRFWTGVAQRPEKNAFERRALINKQFPSTAVLGCSDSRVPVEIVFDQGLGDMFVVRVAGNCLDTTTTASLQFAVNHLKVKVLLVMGHEGCGAVKAAQLPQTAIDGEPEALGSLLGSLKKGLDGGRLANVVDTKAHDREAVTTNVKRQVEKLLLDKHIMAKVKSRELIIVGCFYEISSGIVDFFHEVSETDEPGSASPAGGRAPSRGVISRLQSSDVAAMQTQEKTS